MIQLRHISKHYNTAAGRVAVLHDINLDIAQGDYLCIRGSSGSGKSTLLNILGCLDAPSSGEYQWQNHALHAASEAYKTRLRREKIGFVFQRFHLIPSYTALRNVELPLIYAGSRAAARLRRARQVLEQMGLGNRLDHYPNQLSGGQQQRVAIARGIVNRPAVLIADEPTGALDETSGKQIMAIFDLLNRSGVTVILVTHDEAVAAHARRTVLLRDGHMVSAT